MIKNYYLIDYENVKDDGLEGCDKLKNTDLIIIFFTKNAMKINMTKIANHGDAGLDMIEVPAGKQSADIHIGSYLGYLAGSSRGENTNVVIVSRDTDFDNVIKFWNKKTGIKASRRPKIKDSKDAAGESEKTNLNKEVMQAVSKAGYSSNISNKVAQAAAGLYGEEDFSNKVHNALVKKVEKPREVYKVIKPVLHRYEKKNRKTSGDTKGKQDKIALNAQIMKLLSNAGFNNEIIGYTASVVAKNISSKDAKNVIYNKLVSKYGQETGLKIYNLIKKKIN